MQQKLSGSFDCRNSSFKHCGYGITSDGGAANYTIREYTTFINNGLGCELSNQNGAIELSNTYFTNNKFGLKLDNNHQVMNVKSSTFSKNRRVGILTESIRSMVVSGCTFSDHNNKSFLAADDINLEINSPIYFDQPFEPCEKEELPCFGIFNVKNSNIILTNGTLFENNNFGVYKADPEKGIDVYHSKDSDALVIDCTTFDNNIYAIKGKSIEIQADATSNQLTSKTPVRSNNFIQGKQGKYFFDVAYFYKAAQPALILLRENYWNTKKNGPGMEPDPLTINFYSINFTNTPDCLHCPANNGGCIPYDASDYLSDPNGNCYPTGKSANDKIPTDEFLKISANGTCNTLVSSGFAGVKTPIHAQYRFAYNELFSPDSNIDKVMESFTRVAIMPLKKEDKSVCAQYIRVARAFTGYNPDNIGELEVGKVQQKAPIVASIYPNPADNMLQVNYDKGAFTVNVLDLKGQVIYKNEAEYGLEINTSTWQSGVYQVSITDKTTGNQSVKKVVIMRGN